MGSSTRELNETGAALTVGDTEIGRAVVEVPFTRDDEPGTLSVEVEGVTVGRTGAATMVDVFPLGPTVVQALPWTGGVAT